MPRIHWKYDGTILWRIHPTTGVKIQIDSPYFLSMLDGDAALDFSVDFYGYLPLFQFPDTIQVSKIIMKLTAVNSGLVFKVSTNSTDGVDGDWTDVGSGDYTPAYAIKVFTLTPTNAKWLKIYKSSAFAGYNYFFHVFGEYQSPNFEYWNSGGTAELTGDFPFALADAPNDSDYYQTFGFKIKNLDSSAHKYTATIAYVRQSGDDTIMNNFDLSLDGGTTKLPSVIVPSVAAGALSGLVTLVGDVKRIDNPMNGIHYFWINVAQMVEILDDIFGSGTQQDMMTGGDGAKLYNWNLLNSAYASKADVNITNAGMLTMQANTNKSYLAQNPNMTAPFVFQQLIGDFDIETYISAYTLTNNNEYCGICVRDPYADANEDNIVIGLLYATGVRVNWRNIVDGTYAESYAAGTDKYFRIKRVGFAFYLYSKVNSGDPWISRANFTRYDFHSTLQVGLFIEQQPGQAGTMIAQYDYFRATV